MNESFKASALLAALALVVGCGGGNAPTFEELNLEALTTPCACLEAAAVTFDHTSDLVLEIKRLSDDARRRTNLGEPTPDAVLDSMLMLSEQLRTDLEGTGMKLEKQCEEVVDLEAIGKREQGSDCDELAGFLLAYDRLTDIKTGVMR